MVNLADFFPGFFFVTFVSLWLILLLFLLHRGLPLGSLLALGLLQAELLQPGQSLLGRPAGGFGGVGVIGLGFGVATAAFGGSGTSIRSSVPPVLLVMSSPP